MNNTLRTLLLPLCAMLAVPPDTAAQAKTIVSLATATPGGGFPVYGDAFTAGPMNLSSPRE